MKDTFSNFKAVQAIVPAVKAAAADGDAIDMQGFNSALIVVNAGAVAGDGEFSVKLQESDTTTSGDFTDVAAIDQHGTAPAVIAANSVVKLGYVGSKRYVRVAVTKAGGTSIALGAVAILGHAAVSPVA